MSMLIPEMECVAAALNGSGMSGGFAGNAGMIAALIRRGMRKGYPDIVVDVAARGYHGLRIELKRVAGGTEDDPDQDKWRTRLQRQGYCVEMARGWVAASYILTWYLRDVLTPAKFEVLRRSLPPP